MGAEESFLYESKFKIWVAGEGGYSKRISLNKNPNVNKKCGGDAGVGRVRWGLKKVFFI